MLAKAVQYLRAAPEICLSSTLLECQDLTPKPAQAHSSTAELLWLCRQAALHAASPPPAKHITPCCNFFRNASSLAQIGIACPALPMIPQVHNTMDW